MKVVTIANIESLLTEKECMQILKITDKRTFRKLKITKVVLNSYLYRYEPETLREFIKSKNKS